MKLPVFLVVLILLFSTRISAQQSDEQQVWSMLQMQQSAWNAGDIDKYMTGYWQDDSVAFIGKHKATYGWKNVLNNYKKGYPDKETMGLLNFSDLSIHRISDNQYFVLGAWNIVREKGKEGIGGRFHLIYKFINGKWLIVMDYTT